MNQVNIELYFEVQILMFVDDWNGRSRNSCLLENEKMMFELVFNGELEKCLEFIRGFQRIDKGKNRDLGFNQGKFWDYYCFLVLMLLEDYEECFKLLKKLEKILSDLELFVVLKFLLRVGKRKKFKKFLRKVKNSLDENTSKVFFHEINLIQIDFLLSKKIIPVNNLKAFFKKFEEYFIVKDVNEMDIGSLFYRVQYLVRKGKFLDYFERDLEAELCFHESFLILEVIKEKLPQLFRFMGDVMLVIVKHYKEINYMQKIVKIGNEFNSQALPGPLSSLIRFYLLLFELENKINYETSEEINKLKSFDLFFYGFINDVNLDSNQIRKKIETLLHFFLSNPYIKKEYIAKIFKFLAIFQGKSEVTQIIYLLKKSIYYYKLRTSFKQKSFENIFKLISQFHALLKNNQKARKYSILATFKGTYEYLNFKSKKEIFTKKLKKNLELVQVINSEPHQNKFSYKTIEKCDFFHKFSKIKTYYRVTFSPETFQKSLNFYEKISPFGNQTLKVIGIDQISSLSIFFEKHSPFKRSSSSSLTFFESILSTVEFLLKLSKVNLFIGNLSPEMFVFDKNRNIKISFLDDIDAQMRSVDQKNHKDTIFKFYQLYPPDERRLMFLPPEVRNLIESPDMEVNNINCFKIDVFSYGMILLISMFDEQGLDFPVDFQKHQIEDLIKKLKNCRWMRNLLEKMLVLDFDKRIDTYKLFKTVKRMNEMEIEY